MFKKNRIVTVIFAIILACAVFGTVSLAVTRVVFDDSYKFGQTIREIFDNTQDSVVVATIQGKDVSRLQLEFAKFRMGDERLNDGEVLENLAKENLLLDLAEEAGIVFSEQDIRQLIQEEEAYIQAEVERGNPYMLQRVEEDEQFLQGLDISKEEFLEGIYFDFVKYNATYMEYVKYYYENLYQEYCIPLADYIDLMYEKSGDHHDLSTEGNG